MSLIPVFEIGLWNAWIFELCTLLPLPLLTLTPLKKRAPLNPDISALNETERRIFGLSRIVMFLPIIYSIFSPLKLGTMWFYIGFPIALLGLIMYETVWVNLTTTPLDHKLATKGLYRFSRHPMYLTAFLIDVGVSIACASWLFLLLSITSMIFAHIRFTGFEERFLLEKYGNAYREYLNRTPKWIGMPRSRKSD
jgi:protein-S-isoprenylcysteine O-methyltransferase Ste14